MINLNGPEEEDPMGQEDAITRRGMTEPSVTEEHNRIRLSDEIKRNQEMKRMGCGERTQREDEKQNDTKARNE
jgi:hypothetical protein